ncbi:MAG: HAD family hydrolase [Armatimonadota bacterium]
MKYLIWDFDGTLGYREGGMWTLTLLEIIQRAMPALDVTPEHLRGYLRGYPWHTPEQPHPELAEPDAWWAALDPVFFRALTGVGVPTEMTGEMIRAFRPSYTDLSRWRLFPDTLPVLQLLAADGWRHAVLTNHVPELPAIIDHLGLTPHVAALFNSAQTGYEKPHPQAFRKVLDWAVEPEAIWMIGDNPKADVAGAEALGIPAILVRTTLPDVRHCCADLSQVPEIVQKDYCPSN